MEEGSYSPYVHSPEGHEVTTVVRGRWVTEPGGGMESKISIGRSEAGWHISRQWNSGNAEGGGEWSSAYQTRAEAERDAYPDDRLRPRERAGHER
jgi:hypothetical protein